MTPYKDAQKSADRAFSKYIRLRGCLETTDNPEHGRCFTCYKVFPYKELECGHFVKRSCIVLRFDERNGQIQCVPCNHFKGGNLEVYKENLIKIYGEETVGGMLAMRFRLPRMYNVVELREISQKFNRMSGKLSGY